MPGCPLDGGQLFQQRNSLLTLVNPAIRVEYRVGREVFGERDMVQSINVDVCKYLSIRDQRLEEKLQSQASLHRISITQNSRSNLQAGSILWLHKQSTVPENPSIGSLELRPMLLSTTFSVLPSAHDWLAICGSLFNSSNCIDIANLVECLNANDTRG